MSILPAKGLYNFCLHVLRLFEVQLAKAQHCPSKGFSQKEDARTGGRGRTD